MDAQDIFGVDFRFLRRFSKVFTIYGRGDHLDQVKSSFIQTFVSPFPRRFHIKFGFGEDL